MLRWDFVTDFIFPTDVKFPSFKGSFSVEIVDLRLTDAEYNDIILPSTR